MTFLQAMLLAVLQGVSELFPISSLGHIVLVPALLHWNIDRSDPTFLAFVVALHLATAIALLVFYRNDWVRIVRALVGSIARGKMSDDRDERIAWLLIYGTIPVGLAGVLFEGPVRKLFGSTGRKSPDRARSALTTSEICEPAGRPPNEVMAIGSGCTAAWFTSTVMSASAGPAAASAARPRTNAANQA